MPFIIFLRYQNLGLSAHSDLGEYVLNPADSSEQLEILSALGSLSLCMTMTSGVATDKGLVSVKDQLLGTQLLFCAAALREEPGNQHVMPHTVLLQHLLPRFSALSILF